MSWHFLGTNAISAVTPMEDYCDSGQTNAVGSAREAKEDAEHDGRQGQSKQGSSAVSTLSIPFRENEQFKKNSNKPETSVKKMKTITGKKKTRQVINVKNWRTRTTGQLRQHHNRSKI